MNDQPSKTNELRMKVDTLGELLPGVELTATPEFDFCVLRSDATGLSTQINTPDLLEMSAGVLAALAREALGLPVERSEAAGAALPTG